MKLILISSGLIVMVVLISWMGLQITPRPFAIDGHSADTPGSQLLPDTIPDNIRAFYENLYGKEVPLIHSAIISGTGSMKIKGITFPARFCFIHQSGENYRHYFELTFWGLTIMKVNEYYIDGEARLELPFGVVEHEPKVNQGANLALWGEALWFPSVYITDPRVEWIDIDSRSAKILVPFGNEKQELKVRFDDTTYLPESMEAMRYKGTEHPEKVPWLIEFNQWQEIEEHLIFKDIAITWGDEGTPWARFSVNRVSYNHDVSDLLVSKHAPGFEQGK